MAVSLFVRFNAGTCPHAMRLALFKCKKLHASSRLCLAANKGPCHVENAVSTYRCLSMSHSRSQEMEAPKTSIADTECTFVSDGEKLDKESFIPMTRLSMIRFLVEEKGFLTDEEKSKFPGLSRSLDRAISFQYQGVLEELKNLFDPINPDKDTLHTREFSRGERLDNEFWLLHQLEDIMSKANFRELPKPTVEKFLKEHMTSEGVRVSVDWNRYDVLRFWVLGHEQPKVELSLTERLTNAVLRQPPRQSSQCYKRVIVAVRLKKDSKLILKAFKEVPVQCLEMLLPDGTVKISTFDKGVLVSSVSIAAFGILAKMVTYLASYHMDWMLLLTSVTGLIAFRAWSMYKNKRNEYIIKVTQMLYYKNIANNRSLLAVLVDRAEEESFKEALLTYAFLVTSLPAHCRGKSTHGVPAQHLGLTMPELQQQVEDWVESKTGARPHFNSSDAVTTLIDLGLLRRKGHRLCPVMMDKAITMLPPAPVPSNLGLSVDRDILEGFDRDRYLETEGEYKEKEKKMSKYGWF